MSKSSRSGNGSDKRQNSGGSGPTPAAKRKQLIVALVMGTLMGVIISAITGFWYWLPAGIALGLATGVIMKPPAD